MTYEVHSIEARLLRGETTAVGIVSRWVSIVLTDVRFSRLRADRLDLHQETMSRIVASLRRGRFEAGRDFRSYVQAIARHTIQQARRRRAREGDVGNTDTTIERGAGGEAAILRQLMVKRALAPLSPDCRRLVESYFFEGLDYEEIATSLGVPIGTVKSRLFRCLQAARRGFGAQPGTKAGSAAKDSIDQPNRRGEPER